MVWGIVPVSIFLATGSGAELSFAITGVLGAATLFATYGFYLVSTGAAPGKEWIVRTLRWLIFFSSIVFVALVFVLGRDELSSSDVFTALVFLLCQTAASVGDIASARWKKNRTPAAAPVAPVDAP